MIHVKAQINEEKGFIFSKSMLIVNAVELVYKVLYSVLKEK